MPRPVLLITGASRGIGAATAQLAGARGYDVAVNYKSDAKAAAEVVAAVKAAGGKAVAIQADMAHRGRHRAHVRRGTTRSGRSPISSTTPASAATNSRLDDAERRRSCARCSTSTVFGALLCARAAIRRMSNKHGGRAASIVLLSSMAATSAAPANMSGMPPPRARSTLMTSGLARSSPPTASASTASRPGRSRPRSTPPGRLERIAPMIPMGRAGQAGGDRRGGAVPAVGRGVLHQRHGAARRRGR